MTPKELEQSIRTLMQSPKADAELLGQLEQLAAVEVSFSGLTWLFGPELYRRNRVLFRPFILSRFSPCMLLPNKRWEVIDWKGDKAKVLEAWLAEADKNDDADLFRRLYQWKLSGRVDWRNRDVRSREIVADLQSRFRSAGSPVRRQTVLRKFDLRFNLDEASACALYSVDAAAAAPYILQRLRAGCDGDEPERALWSRLLQLADQRRDEGFRWQLYRRQIPMQDWAKECLALCDRLRDPAELIQELEKRHPEGPGVNLAGSFYKFIQRRGRDLFPYVRRHLRQVLDQRLTRSRYGKMADYAREKGWWDLWSAIIRTCDGPEEFNEEVLELLENRTRPEKDTVEGLLALAGVLRKWNWAGFGAASVHLLQEPVALKLYERFPDLLRGPYKLHVQPRIGGWAYPELIERCRAAGDEDMVDFLSRQERLARFLSLPSPAAYLADPRSLADLIEALGPRLMSSAYRALALDDDRARQQASLQLPLLIGTLLGPMEPDMRALAFGALANAANTVETARLILERAKDALNLPEERYPKEKLLGLIAQLIHRWPELRGPREKPVVYERAA